MAFPENIRKEDGWEAEATTNSSSSLNMHVLGSEGRAFWLPALQLLHTHMMLTLTIWRQADRFAGQAPVPPSARFVGRDTHFPSPLTMNQTLPESFAE